MLISPPEPKFLESKFLPIYNEDPQRGGNELFLPFLNLVHQFSSPKDLIYHFCDKWYYKLKSNIKRTLYRQFLLYLYVELSKY